jgi:CO/xanthine dehydrogenase Mo-binding subunit
MNGGGKSSAQGRVNPDGTVTLLEGSVDIGGTRTSVAMQMAEVLGIPIEDINPIVPDTDSINFTGVTGGSRVTYATGYAAYEAARDIVRQMIDGMADIWEVDPREVEFDDAVFSTNGQTVTFKQAAALLEEEDLGILGTATVSPSRAGNTFSVQAADVEVDTETGKVQVLRYTGTQDAGVAIYPPYVEGQLQGGIVQGIGWALNEEYFYDSEGRLRNASLLDYRMPTSLDLPMIDTIITEVPNPGHPYGVRGVGEVSIAPPPATIANAIHDAIKVRMRDLPMSPPRVQKAISENAVN